MKKISLKNLNLKEVEQLSREQLKNVLGGYTGGTGGPETETETVPTKECGDYCGGDDGDCNGSCQECKEGDDPIHQGKKANVCQ